MFYEIRLNSLVEMRFGKLDTLQNHQTDQNIHKNWTPYLLINPKFINL